MNTAASSGDARRRGAGMAIRLSLVGLLMIAVMIGPRLRPGRPPEDEARNGLHRAVAYERLIDEVFVPRQWLIAHRQRPPLDPTPVVTVRSTVREALNKVIRATFLRADIEANDEARWRFRGNVVQGAEPGAHVTLGPFARARTWQGDITWADQDEPSHLRLIGDGGVVDFAPPKVGWTPADGAPEAVPLSMHAPWPPTPGLAYVLQDSGRAAIVEIRRAGDRILIRREPEWTGAVSIDGAPLQSSKAIWQALGHGQTLQITSGEGRSLRLRLDGDDAQAISLHSIGAERPPPDPDVQPLADGMVAAMQSWVESHPEAEAGRNLATSLIRPVQVQAQEGLAQACEQLRPQTRDKKTFRCASMVMDALTGRIWALGSYPTRLPQLLLGEQDSLRERETLKRENNFERLAVGSVAKIPYTAAILDIFPKMASLVITAPGRAGPPDSQGAPKSGFGTLLGQTLERPVVEEAGARGQVPFGTYICESSNKYASAMMLLATAPDPLASGGATSSETFWLDGSARRDLPPGMATTRLGPGGSGVLVRRGAFDSQFGAGWPTALERLFGTGALESVTDDRGDRRSLEDAYDLGVWTGLDGMEAAQVRATLAQVSPERESLGLNLVSSLRDDYLELVMGGGAGPWTNVRIAEIFARLLDARTDLTPRLTQLGPDPPAEAPSSARFSQGSGRPVLLAAMEKVVGQGCTGGKIMGPAVTTFRAKLTRSALRENLQLRIFAKTGTPTIEVPQPTAVDQALNSLLTAGLLHIDPQRRDTPAALRHAFSHDEDVRTELRAYGVGEEAAVARLLAVERHPRELLTSNERDPGAFWIRDPTAKTEHDGSVFAFVAGIYEGAETDPARALAAMSVVVNIQGRKWLGEDHLGPNAAAEFGAELLDGAAGDQLIRQALAMRQKRNAHVVTARR